MGMSGYRLGHSPRKVITSITWIVIVVLSLPPNSSFGQNRDSSATFAAMKEAVPQMLGGATYDSVFILERGIVDLVDSGGI
jgi:hypothetical protein